MAIPARPVAKHDLTDLRAPLANEPPFRVWDPNRPQSPCGFAFLGLKPSPRPSSQQQYLNWNDVRTGELRGIFVAYLAPCLLYAGMGVSAS